MTKLSYIYKYSLRDILPYAFYRCDYKTRQLVDSFIANILVRWWNIHTDGRLLAYGIPKFQKHMLGKISIGNNCKFRSASWSNSVILRRCFISANRDATITIGNDCGFSGTVISADNSIIIGNRVLCGANCLIFDTDFHPLNPNARFNDGIVDTKPVVIEDDVWLGLGVAVLKGVTIGKGTIVAANSIVSRSLPEYVVAAGIPARVVKRLDKIDESHITSIPCT
ncbi:MAG: acyltransferase [Bacteroidales bacterium]|nr:acyltransferase [Bacteroidales bacterium]